MNTICLQDSEFHQFQAWLHRTAGISLSEAKKPLVAGRLFKRLRHYGLENYGDYLRLIMGSDGAAELQVALDMLTTNETYFFREPKHFDFLREKVLPQARSGQPFRVWSAACSSGEEPYSLAMTLADGLGSTPWEIVASDISTQVLARACTGHYPMTRASTLPREQLVKYCLKGVGRQEGTFLVESQLRRRIQFLQVNLNEPLPQIGEFNLVFLRNVMIYLEMETKRQVVARMLPLLKPGGHLIVSHSESLNGVCESLQLIAPSIYRKP